LKSMPFKNDLEMFHKFAEYADWIRFVSESMEHKLYSLCVYYHWDGEACEESCSCEQIERKGDFHAEDECWQCSSYISGAKKC